MALHWEMVHLKGAGRSVLRDYTVDVFDQHAEYLLGDECLLIGEANPTMTCTPSWELLMKYEFELRRLAIRKVNEGGMTLAEGMAFARRSVEHRTSYFITPLAMPGSRAQAPRPAAFSVPETRGSKRPAGEITPYTAGGGGGGPAAAGTDKGRGKGGKGKDKKRKVATSVEELKKLSPRSAYQRIRNDPARYGLQFRDTSGVPRCHNFQSGSCSQAGCKFTHTCARCGGSHGATACPDLGLGS